MISILVYQTEISNATAKSHVVNTTIIIINTTIILPGIELGNEIPL